MGSCRTPQARVAAQQGFIVIELIEEFKAYEDFQPNYDYTKHINPGMRAVYYPDGRYYFYLHAGIAMIVSDLESLFIRFILGGFIDAKRRGQFTREHWQLLNEFWKMTKVKGHTAGAIEELMDVGDWGN